MNWPLGMRSLSCCLDGQDQVFGPCVYICRRFWGGGFVRDCRSQGFCNFAGLRESTLHWTLHVEEEPWHFVQSLMLLGGGPQLLGKLDEFLRGEKRPVKSEVGSEDEDHMKFATVASTSYQVLPVLPSETCVAWAAAPSVRGWIFGGDPHHFGFWKRWSFGPCAAEQQLGIWRKDGTVALRCKLLALEPQYLQGGPW